MLSEHCHAVLPCCMSTCWLAGLGLWDTKHGLGVRSEMLNLCRTLAPCLPLPHTQCYAPASQNDKAMCLGSM